LVIVWTVTGASPPTATLPTMICRDLRRSIVRQGLMEDIARHIGARLRVAKRAATRLAGVVKFC
jgi:hypothetical protein